MFRPRRYLARILHIAGFWRVYSSGATIVSYHGISETDDKQLTGPLFPLALFLEHLNFFGRHRAVISLDEMMSSVRERREPDRRAVVICFDDALEGVFRYGAPELADRGFPFTIGIPAGLPDSGRTLWEYEAALLIRRLEKRAALDLLGPALNKIASEKTGGGAVFHGVDVTERGILRRLKHYLRDEITSEDRMRILDFLIDSLQPDLRDYVRRNSNYRIMSWRNIKQCIASGGTLASHGYFHFPHNAGLTEACRDRELSMSKRIIEEKTGQKIDTFIWPEGARTEDSLKAAVDCGYKTILSSRSGPVRADTLPHDVPRVSGEWQLPQMLWNSLNIT